MTAATCAAASTPSTSSLGSDESAACSSSSAFVPDDLWFYLWFFDSLYCQLQPVLWIIVSLSLRLIIRKLWIRKSQKPARKVPTDVEQLAGYVKAIEEQSHASSPLLEGAEKHIYWAKGEGKKTKQAIVFLHGFTACRQEFYPIIDKVAEKIGANAYFARLSGHGGTDSCVKMCDARGANFVQDAYEALDIAETLCEEEVILIGHSTGSALCTFLMATEKGKRLVKKSIISSPAFGFNNSAMQFFSQHHWFGDTWIRSFILRLVLGNYDQWEGQNEKQNYWWSTMYPSFALIGVMEACAIANYSKLEDIRTKVLCVCSPTDSVINHKILRKTASRIPDVSFWCPPVFDCKTGHNVIGNIMSPSSTNHAIDRIVLFLSDNDEPNK